MALVLLVAIGTGSEWPFLRLGRFPLAAERGRREVPPEAPWAQAWSCRMALALRVAIGAGSEWPFLRLGRFPLGS